MFDRLGLFTAHRKGLVMRAGELLPVRSSVSTVFTSLTVQRIHSSSVFANFFLTSAARTSWSLKMVPSSRSADSSSSIV